MAKQKLDLHRDITMNRRISQLFPHERAKHPDLLRRPTQKPRQQRKQQALQPARQVLARPGPNVLVSLVLGPLVERPLVAMLDHVDESRLFEVVLVLGRRVVWAAGLVACLDEEVAELAELEVCG